MPPCQLDADILSEMMKDRSLTVRANAAAYLAAHGRFSFSTLTRYQVRRGLMEKRAAARLQKFVNFCTASSVMPITDEILDMAGDLWLAARQAGRKTNDADLIIAATALSEGVTLATGNTRDFIWIPGLALIDWRQA